MAAAAVAVAVVPTQHLDALASAAWLAAVADAVVPDVRVLPVVPAATESLALTQ